MIINLQDYKFMRRVYEIRLQRMAGIQKPWPMIPPPGWTKTPEYFEAFLWD